MTSNNMHTSFGCLPSWGARVLSPVFRSQTEVVTKVTTFFFSLFFVVSSSLFKPGSKPEFRIVFDKRVNSGFMVFVCGTSGMIDRRIYISANRCIVLVNIFNKYLL